MADQNITALPKKKPVDGDYLLGIGTSEEYQMLLNDLADVILNKLTSKTFALDAGTSTILAALNTLNSNTSGMTYINAGTFLRSDYDTIHKAAQHIVDNVLPNKELNFLFVSFGYETQHMMIAQKYRYSDEFGAYIVFGYGEKSILYGNKESGTWYTN